MCYKDEGTLEQGTEAHRGLIEGLYEEGTCYLKPGGHAYMVYTKGRRETYSRAEPSMTA